MSANETLHNAQISHQAAAGGGHRLHNALLDLSCAREDEYSRARDRELIARLKEHAAPARGAKSDDEAEGCCDCSSKCCCSC